MIHIVDARGESGEPIPVEGEFEWVIDFDCDAQHDRLVVQTNLGASNQLVLIDLETPGLGVLDTEREILEIHVYGYADLATSRLFACHLQSHRNHRTRGHGPRLTHAEQGLAG